MRRVPVQGAEVLFFAVAAAAGPVVVALAPGRFLLALSLGYAVVRFALEGLRGDDRPTWLGISESRWFCLALFVLGLALLPEITLPGAALAAAALAGGALLWASRGRWHRSTGPTNAEIGRLEKLGRELDARIPAIGVHTEDVGRWRIGLSRGPGGELGVSVSRPGRSPSRVEAELVLETVLRAAGSQTPRDLHHRNDLWMGVVAEQEHEEAPPRSTASYFQRPGGAS